MELLGEASQRRFVAEILQLGLFHGVLRHWSKRPRHIFLGDRIGGKRWSRVRIQRFPGRRPHSLLDREVSIPLESQYGLFKIDPVRAIDLEKTVLAFERNR